MGAESQLRIVRGSRERVIAQGTLDELVAMARAGKLHPWERVVGLRPDGPLEPPEVPELSGFVPGPLEHADALAERGLRCVHPPGVLLASCLLVPLLLRWVAPDPRLSADL